MERVEEPVFGNVQELVTDGSGRTRVVTKTVVVGNVTRYSDKLLETALRGNRREKYNVRQHELTAKEGAPVASEQYDFTRLDMEQRAQLKDLLMIALIKPDERV